MRYRQLERHRGRLTRTDFHMSNLTQSERAIFKSHIMRARREKGLIAVVQRDGTTSLGDLNFKRAPRRGAIPNKSIR